MDANQTQICNGNEPKHSQVELTKHSVALGTTIIKTTLIPIPCQNNPIEPQYTKTNSKFTSQLFAFPQVNDTVLNYHFSNEIDSIINENNPFALSDNTIQLTTNAKSIFFSYATNPIFISGGCTSQLNFRKLKMQKGRSLIYHDTTYFSANKNIDFFYEITGKCKYRAFSDCDSGTTIEVFIPDGIVGQNMIIRNSAITSSYKDTTRILTINLPVGFVYFEI